MNKQIRKSMTLEDLAMYIKDLHRMGFVTEHVGEDKQIHYKLTDLGVKSGLQDLPEVKIKKR